MCQKWTYIPSDWCQILVSNESNVIREHWGMKKNIQFISPFDIISLLNNRPNCTRFILESFETKIRNVFWPIYSKSMCGVSYALIGKSYLSRSRSLPPFLRALSRSSSFFRDFLLGDPLRLLDRDLFLCFRLLLSETEKNKTDKYWSKLVKRVLNSDTNGANI